MTHNIQLSIIIVEYHSGPYLPALLAKLPKRNDWEVIVVNNEQENRGYGGGLNFGAGKAKGKYLLFLNPDVLIDEKAIETLCTYLEKHPKVGIVGPKFLDKNGKTEQCSTQFPTVLRSVVVLSFLNTLFPHNHISTQYWMKDWDRESTREVDVVSGAVIMVRAVEFQKLGMFDTHMFLYWEEFDLCARYKKELNLSTIYVSTAVAVHPKEVSMKQGKNIHESFITSRRTYFAKHLGIGSMMCIETWLWICEQWRFLCVGFLALFLRTWDLGHLTLIGDVGRDYLEALKIIKLESLPLMGIPSSIPRFLQGPLNVWFSAVSFFFGGVHPFSPVLFSAGVTTFGVLYVMFLSTQIYGKKSGFLAGACSAVMMSGVLQSRMPFYLFAIPLFLCIHLYAVLNLRSTWKSIFITVISYWLVFQWEIATLPLLLPLCVHLWKFPLSWKKKVSVGVLASVIGLLPQLIYDVMHQCSQICGLGAWALYRVIAFTGFDGRHGVATLSLHTLLISFHEQIDKLLGLGIWSGVAFTAIFCASIIYLQKKKDFLAEYVLFSSIILLISIFIHGSPSEAYFPPFLVFIPILVAFIYARSSKLVQLLFSIGIGVFVLVNATLLVSHHFFAQPIRAQLDAAQWIVQDAKSETVSLYSYDEPAKVPTYLDHMKFLVRMYGGKVSPDGVRYIISLDERVQLPSIDIVQQTFGYIRVVKYLSTP